MKQKIKGLLNGVWYNSFQIGGKKEEICKHQATEGKILVKNSPPTALTQMPLLNGCFL